jgi:hypothetical protein
MVQAGAIEGIQSIGLLISFSSVFESGHKGNRSGTSREQVPLLTIVSFLLGKILLAPVPERLQSEVQVLKAEGVRPR